MSEICHIESWFPILNWDKLPNLGSCHTINNYRDFLRNYFVSYEIDKFKKNLFATLTGEFEIPNMKIMGRPGCGKTSFIYYLLKSAANEKNILLSKYFFYIFHANRAAGAVTEDVIVHYILEAWGEYYSACGNGDIFSRINRQNVSAKEKLNKLTDFFKKRRGEFGKILIFVIDDADLLSDDEVREL